MGGRPVHIVRGGLRRVRPRAADDQRVRGAGAGRLRGRLRGRVRGRPPPRDPPLRHGVLHARFRRRAPRAEAGRSARGPGAAAPFTLQVSVPASDPAGLAAREKGLDATLAGFAGKADLPDPYDVPADAYRKTAARVARGLFVGEVRLPARALGDLQGKVQGIAGQAGVKAGLLASLRADGTASAFPFFEAQKDRVRVYELSKGVHRVAKTVPAAAFVSRLAPPPAGAAGNPGRVGHP